MAIDFPPAFTRRLLLPLLAMGFLLAPLQAPPEAAAQQARAPRLSPEIAQAGSSFMSRLGRAQSQEDVLALFDDMMDYDHFMGATLGGLPAGTQTEEFREAFRLYLAATAWNYVSYADGLAFSPESAQTTEAGEQISGQLNLRLRDPENPNEPAEDHTVRFSLTFARTTRGVKLRDLTLMSGGAVQSTRQSMIELTETAPESPERWPAMILRSAGLQPEPAAVQEQP